MFNYFFGSDKRSVNYLKFLHNKNNEITVVTTKPVVAGRGKNMKANDIELFCIKNSINFKYFNQNDTYEDMVNAFCVSFKSIFTDNFLNNNKDIYNLHLSLLPKYKGPSPVETQILNGETKTGYTIFKINKYVDAGPVMYSKELNLLESHYASDIYKLIFDDFISSYDEIITSSNPLENQNDINETFTKKFEKKDLCVNNDSIKIALKKIRAFDLIGPAYYIHNNKVFKIHKYTLETHGLEFKLLDGYIYPIEITPEGKNRMCVVDYVRGIR
tara:strand:+ start:521 stop:1336 length:816 start_codon:yes stop_codon:yes gene_type:complete